MISLIIALSRALQQLFDPAILRVLAKSALVTVAIFALLGAGGWYLADRMFAQMQWPYAAGMGVVAASLLMIVGAWLLFRLAALFVLQFFADEVVHAVEVKHYPQVISGTRSIGWREELGHSLRGAGRVIMANLLAAPFAIILLATGIGAPILFWAVNSWLLGRELQDIVWLRHQRDAGEPAPLGGAGRFALGAVVATLLMVPFINLLAPVIGAATAAHLIHGQKGPANAA